MKLKVCGITRLEDARYVVAAGATHLGFIQDPSSPRYIAPRAAKEIIDWVYGAVSVGVFVDPDIAELNAAIEIAGFDMVQLHGDESTSFCASIDKPFIKVISIDENTTNANLREKVDMFSGVADWLMFDSSRAATHRTAFDWTLLSELNLDQPFFLAGGIDADNIAEALSIRPDGIDLSSSLESSPGVKDFDLVDLFMSEFSKQP